MSRDQGVVEVPPQTNPGRASMKSPSYVRVAFLEILLALWSFRDWRQNGHDAALMVLTVLWVVLAVWDLVDAARKHRATPPRPNVTTIRITNLGPELSPESVVSALRDLERRNGAK